MVLDAGARGDLFSPIDEVDASERTVIRVEPDPNAEIRGQADHVLRSALWSRAGQLDLHLTAAPTCSSIHPPDARLVDGFEPVIGRRARHIVDVVEVECVSLDAAVAADGVPSPDLIKLDIHGSELEALEGAGAALRDTVVAVLVECWPVRLHRGQASMGALHGLLEDSGFMLVDAALGRWPRTTRGGVLRSRGQVVQMELLYLVDALGDRAAGFQRERLLKLVAVADLFGHSALAEQMMEAADSAGVLARGDAERIEATLRCRHRPSRWDPMRARLARRLAPPLSRFGAELSVHDASRTTTP